MSFQDWEPETIWNEKDDIPLTEVSYLCSLVVCLEYSVLQSEQLPWKKGNEPTLYQQLKSLPRLNVIFFTNKTLRWSKIQNALNQGHFCARKCGSVSNMQKITIHSVNDILLAIVKPTYSEIVNFSLIPEPQKKVHNLCSFGLFWSRQGAWWRYDTQELADIKRNMWLISPRISW